MRRVFEQQQMRRYLIVLLLDRRENVVVGAREPVLKSKSDITRVVPLGPTPSETFT